MELIAVWDFVRRRWWLIVLPVLAALLLALPSLPGALSPAPHYGVQMRLTVAAPPQPPTEQTTTPYEDTAYVPWLASEYIVVNLPAWIASDSFAEQVSDVLSAQGIALPATDLGGAFAAEGLRSILTLHVRWDSAAEVVPITQAAVTVLQSRNQSYFPQFAGEPVSVVPLDEIRVQSLAAPITQRLDPLLRVAVGLAAGVALAALAEYLDRTVRTRADAEALGLAVLAEIPRHRE